MSRSAGNKKHAALLVIGVAVLLLSVANLIGLFVVSADEDEPVESVSPVVRINCERSGGSYAENACTCPVSGSTDPAEGYTYDTAAGYCIDAFGLPGGELGRRTQEGLASRMEESSSVRTFENSSLSFDYPNGWHISGLFDYDNPDGEQHILRLSSHPLVSVSPSDVGLPYTIIMRSYRQGDAVYAPYEERNWSSYESDTIEIDGQEVTRLRLAAQEGVDFVAPYSEVVFVTGEEIGFEVVYEYADPSQAENPDWLTIRDSLHVK